MLKLRPGPVSDTEAVLEAHGAITGAYAELLAREACHWRARPQRSVLDLSGVRLVDAVGAAALRGCVTAGMTLRGGSTFVRALLAGFGLPQSEDTQEE